MSVKQLKRCRDALPTRKAAAVYAMKPAELKIHWEKLAEMLGLTDRNRDDVEILVLPSKKVP
jgi:hypothetical protein